MTTAFAPRATVVQLYAIHSPSLALKIIYQNVYHGLPSIISAYYADKPISPLGILKTYDNSPDPQYFFIYFLRKPSINITSSPQRCLPVSTLLPSGELYFITWKFGGVSVGNEKFTGLLYKKLQGFRIVFTEFS
jgi:hypothetical protein